MYSVRLAPLANRWRPVQAGAPAPFCSAFLDSVGVQMASRAAERGGRLPIPGESSAITARLCGSFDRYLLVNEREVDPLPLADDPGGYVHDDRQHVHRAHEDERVVVVDEV